MRRIPEPELMNDPEQALAYASADFEQPHNLFIELFRERFPDLDVAGKVLDLGCGPADITLRFAKAFPECQITGIDGAQAMLALADKAITEQGLADRIKLIHGRLANFSINLHGFDIIISNSLLHHLGTPSDLWASIKYHAKPSGAVFIMDLMRPADLEAARRLVREYASDEADILQQDFYNSLLAAYQIEEVTRQLKESGLDFLSVEAVSDRHLVIYGQMP